MAIILSENDKEVLAIIDSFTDLTMKLGELEAKLVQGKEINQSIEISRKILSRRQALGEVLLRLLNDLYPKNEPV